MEKMHERCSCGGNLWQRKDEKIICLKCKSLYDGIEFADKLF